MYRHATPCPVSPARGSLQGTHRHASFPVTAFEWLDYSRLPSNCQALTKRKNNLYTIAENQPNCCRPYERRDSLSGPLSDQCHIGMEGKHISLRIRSAQLKLFYRRNNAQQVFIRPSPPVSVPSSRSSQEMETHFDVDPKAFLRPIGLRFVAAGQ